MSIPRDCDHITVRKNVNDVLLVFTTKRQVWRMIFRLIKKLCEDNSILNCYLRVRTNKIVTQEEG